MNTTYIPTITEFVKYLDTSSLFEAKNGNLRKFRKSGLMQKNCRRLTCLELPDHSLPDHSLPDHSRSRFAWPGNSCLSSIETSKATIFTDGPISVRAVRLMTDIHNSLQSMLYRTNTILKTTGFATLTFYTLPSQLKTLMEYLVRLHIECLESRTNLYSRLTITATEESGQIRIAFMNNQGNLSRSECFNHTLLTRGRLAFLLQRNKRLKNVESLLISLDAHLEINSEGERTGLTLVLPGSANSLSALSEYIPAPETSPLIAAA